METLKKSYDSEYSLEGINKRISDWYELARSNDIERMFVVVGCDDQRVELPSSPQKIVYNNKENNALFLLVPAIGGGHSNRVLTDVLENLTKEGVAREKITVITTQHAGSEEIQNPEQDKKQCGARNVINKYRDMFNSISTSTDSTELAEKLSDESGIPAGLILHLAETNFDANLNINDLKVYEATKTSLLNAGFGDIEITHGIYDHEQKNLHIKKEDTNLIKLPGLAEWVEPYQDPDILTVSFGINASSVPNDLLIPEFIGLHRKNDFKAAATDETGLWNAFYELWYALSHVGGHGEDLNFKNTNKMLIICDNEVQSRAVKDILNSDSFKKDFDSHLRKLKSVYIATIEDEKLEKIIL